MAAGCPYQAGSSLPEHIQTVRVPTFRNDTFYTGYEARLTRAVIEKLAQDPRVRVVRRGADAELTGEITEIKKRVLRQTEKDRPAAIRLTITVQVSFEDKVEGAMLLDKQVIRSSGASSAAGVYDIERGESRSEAEARALEELADEIVRRTVAMWK
jgi:hypothetical protein